MDCPGSQTRTEDLDSYISLVKPCTFPFAKPGSRLSQNSSLLVSELSLRLPFLGAPVTNATKPWDSYGYDTITSQVEFWLHTLAEQRKGGSARISKPFGNSIVILWLWHQSGPAWEVGDLGAPTAPASTARLTVAHHVSRTPVSFICNVGGHSR